jgi:hypothetical protein
VKAIDRLVRVSAPPTRPTQTYVTASLWPSLSATLDEPTDQLRCFDTVHLVPGVHDASRSRTLLARFCVKRVGTAAQA